MTDQNKQSRSVPSFSIQNYQRMHTKIIVFAVCPNFSNFLCNCPDFFFPENFFTTITNKTKKNNYAYPSLSVFPEFSNFPGNFSNFFYIKTSRIITNIKKNSQIVPAVPTEKKHFKFFPNFPIFRAPFPIFFLFKPPLK
jgi:hypothetical protein